MRRRFYTLDVFTASPFGGNPLAVVTEPAGLDTLTMQAVAREFNLSETVFVFPPEHLGHRARLRIFTPAAELPFAGHPTVGSAVLLALLDGDGAPGATSFTLGETVGSVPCVVTTMDARRGAATFGLPRLPQKLGDATDIRQIAHALGLDVSVVGGTGLMPAFWSAGVPFALVPVCDRAAVDAAAPQMACWSDAFGGVASGHCYVFCVDGDGYYARMFAPTLGVAEDPATGSAVACLAGLLAATRHTGNGQHDIEITQGVAMGRPSRILLTLDNAGGALVAAHIGGEALLMSDGWIET